MKHALRILITAVAAGSIAVAAEPTKAPERIGVYDSRAIAMAYAGSSYQKHDQEELTAKHKKAKEAGDQKEASKLEAQGQANSAKLHKQGFGTAPVDDLLAHVSKALPKIQKFTGVTALVSKWNKAELKKHPNAEQVDVTMQLVDAFHPDDGARKNAIDIQKKKPE
jgi:hypothetical protein